MAKGRPGRETFTSCQRTWLKCVVRAMCHHYTHTHTHTWWRIKVALRSAPVQTDSMHKLTFADVLARFEQTRVVFIWVTEPHCPGPRVFCLATRQHDSQEAGQVWYIAKRNLHFLFLLWMSRLHGDTTVSLCYAHKPECISFGRCFQPVLWGTDQCDAERQRIYFEFVRKSLRSFRVPLKNCFNFNNV